MDDILAQGYWCSSCEFFEEVEPEGARCPACGCSTEAHQPAAVVAVIARG